jgi:retinol dehydrogenase-12
VRIINTASSGAGQAPKEGIPIDDETVGAGASHSACYGHSKLVRTIFLREQTFR